jgi:hypothetical protein
LLVFNRSLKDRKKLCNCFQTTCLSIWLLTSLDNFVLKFCIQTRKPNTFSATLSSFNYSSKSYDVIILTFFVVSYLKIICLFLDMFNFFLFWHLSIKYSHHFKGAIESLVTKKEIALLQYKTKQDIDQTNKPRWTKRQSKCHYL